METGFIVEEAYCKVEEINANKERMNFFIQIYI